MRVREWVISMAPSLVHAGVVVLDVPFVVLVLV